MFLAARAIWPLLKLCSSALVERKQVVFQQNFYKTMYVLADFHLSQV